MRKLGPTDLKRRHREWRRQTTARLSLLLDDVQNPYNVGSIARMAAALRVEQVYLSGNACPPSHPRSRKTSMGTERYLTWSVHETGADAAAAAAGDGYSIVGLELTDTAVPLHEGPLDGDVCIALGHEDRGLSTAVMAAATGVVFIPQLGRVGSLNVAQAAAIALYEVRRREWERATPPSDP